ncbi:MAG: type II toxin-antitoxin system PemK/MazF family toxin [Candidatus Iainarchaeum archaeon]|uniref:Type II toxin-antitoxin system PemK/MazF family toxin n=1 Tax=Candidatus Iainarchaeum sp. TaxID=3101447 RepID=A0A7T9I1K9_9ARCH|nr:MAG: type II toxin-antitoxin system PemK/MazF family toxin [Candidatus Diapherotrites archaeon]
MYNQRDLVLIPVPFTNLDSKKVRPAIVLSNNEYNKHTQDILVVGVTSVPKDEPYSLPLTDEHMEEGKLPLPSRIKCDKIYLLQSKMAVKKYGKINVKTHHSIQQQIAKLLS